MHDLFYNVIVPKLCPKKSLNTLVFHRLCMFVKWFYSFTLIHQLKYPSVLSLSNSQNPNGIWVDQKMNLLIWVTFSYNRVVTAIKLQSSSKWFVNLFWPGFCLSGNIHHASGGSHRGWMLPVGKTADTPHGWKSPSHPLYFEDKNDISILWRVEYNFIVPHLTSETKLMP